MNIPQNARLTRQARALLIRRLRQDGWRVKNAAAAGLSQRPAFRWLARHRAGGARALQDRRSAPARCAPRPDADTLAALERLRRPRRTGPPIARALSLPRSPVGAGLRRRGLGRLSARAAQPEIVRYEREKPGALIHIAIKTRGRIDGVGQCISGERTSQSSQRGTGWESLHVAIDEAGRLADSEGLANETADSAVAFTRRVVAWCQRCGAASNGS